VHTRRPAVLNVCGAILATLAREDARRATKGMGGEEPFIYMHVCMYLRIQCIMFLCRYMHVCMYLRS